MIKSVDLRSNGIDVRVSNQSQCKVYNYSEFEDLPESIKHKKDAEGYLASGMDMLELMDGRFITKRNVKALRDILIAYFGIECNKVEDIVIYIGEYKKVFLEFRKFRISVWVDLD